MSYTPTNWQTGDTVTAEKLNKMEDGIENANDVFVVTFTPTAQDFSGVMDKTSSEIKAAYRAGKRIVAKVLGVYGTNNFYPFINASYVNDYGYDDDLHFVSAVFLFQFTYGGVPLLVQFTAGNSEVDSDIYTSEIFTLTPMS